jgi:hypothetical protein
MFSVVLFVAGVLLGVGGTLAILWMYRWMRRTSNRIESLRDRLDYYRRTEEAWTEFQFTRQQKG